MNLSNPRKILLWVFIGFLSLTAVIAIFSVLVGQFNETQLKVLATTFTISAASICAMSCAAFIEKRQSNLAGTLGIIFAAVAAILTITGVWSETGSDTFWKSTGSLIVISVALAHALLLLLPNLSANHKWTQIAAVISIVILAALIIFLIWRSNFNKDEEFYFRLLGVASIVVVLFTLIIPICAKLGGKQTKRIHPPNLSEHLTLNKIADEIYADEFGRKFQVTEIKSDKF
jgi:hypothetical protein